MSQASIHIIGTLWVSIGWALMALGFATAGVTLKAWVWPARNCRRPRRPTKPTHESVRSCRRCGGSGVIEQAGNRWAVCPQCTSSPD